MKIKTDKKFYNEKNGRVYINGKKRSNVILRPETHTFEEAIREINTTFNKYGLLSKCDRILGLFKRGYDESKVRRSLHEIISQIHSSDFRMTLLQNYIGKLERIKGC